MRGGEGSEVWGRIRSGEFWGRTTGAAPPPSPPRTSPCTAPRASPRARPPWTPAWRLSERPEGSVPVTPKVESARKGERGSPVMGKGGRTLAGEAGALGERRGGPLLLVLVQPLRGVPGGGRAGSGATPARRRRGETAARRAPGAASGARKHAGGSSAALCAARARLGAACLAGGICSRLELRLNLGRGSRELRVTWHPALLRGGADRDRGAKRARGRRRGCRGAGEAPGCCELSLFCREHEERE